MSDPIITNKLRNSKPNDSKSNDGVEIEDVLASIRKLVSDNPRLNTRPDALVLTNAQRAGAGDDTATDISSPDTPNQDIPKFTQRLEETAQSAVEAEFLNTTFSAVADVEEDDWEPEDVFVEEITLNAPEPPAAAIDPEQLRQLVVETVRAELRGALGEKITRNVRKLVRSEIQRALTTQNWE